MKNLIFWPILAQIGNSMNFQEVLSFKPPLTSDKFDHWETEESTVFLQNKIVLAPEGRDQTGFLGQKFVSLR